jgi:predicted nucleic acid-binding protein
VNGKRLVIDASVALKWRLRDEEATSQADALLEDFLAGKLELLTPTLFDYGIANALRVAVTRQRLGEPDAAAALADFAQYTVVRYDCTGMASLTVELSGQYQRSADDSASLALAPAQGVWLVTGDKRLFNAVGHVLSWVKWLGDYQFDTIPVPDTAMPESPDA